MSATPPAGAALTPAQAKKLALWRRLVMGCLWGAAAVLVVEGVLLVWPGVGRTAKLVGIAHDEVRLCRDLRGPFR